MNVVYRTEQWCVRAVDDRHVALHLELIPVVPVDDLTVLDPGAQAGFWRVLAWVVQEYALTHYGVAVAERGPLRVHVLAGDGTGSARFDTATGQVAP